MKKTPGLISVGVAAVIAGCGGGGGSNGPSGGRVEPPTNSGSGRTVSASLRLQIPARGAQTARRRREWISPSSVTLGVRVLASPMPDPTPTEAVYTIPTPGPLPTSITVQVQAPISTDTFIASLYDGNHKLLATGSSAPTAVSLTSTPSVSVTMLGVAGGVQFTVAGSTPSAWRVLENLGAPQTAAIAAQPVDADGNAIPGTLALPVSLTTTGGVTLSTTSITAAASLTATYPSNTAGSGSIASSLSLNAAGSPLNAAVDADYYIFVDDSDGTVYVIDALTQKQVGSPLTGASGTQQIAALSGCASGAFAVSGNSSGAFSYFVPAPTTSNPTPGPVASPLPAAILSADPFFYGAAADSHCDAFYNNTNSGDPLVKLSGFDSTIAANASFASGFGYTSVLRSIDGQIYSPAAVAPTQMQAFYVPEATGGAASASAAYTTPEIGPNSVSIAGTGSSIFLVANTCSGQPILQSLSGGSLITLSQFASISGVAEATDGTVYLAGLSEASNAPTLAYGTLGSIASASTIALGAQPVDVAVTPDQQYVCVLESPGGSSGQLEFFRRTPSPSLAATVPLSASSAPQSFSIGP